MTALTKTRTPGKTDHRGVEYGITYRPSGQWMLRLSATNAKHSFVQDVEKGIDYSGNEMAAAPDFIANAEIMYKPKFIKGLRYGAEWQHQGRYWMDNANSATYKGFDVMNIRAGYRIKQLEVWMNALNAFNQYYAVIASKSTYGYTYLTWGDPRELTLGLSIHFGKTNL